MAGPATILREIHRLRRHAANLRTEIERMPRLLKAQEAKVSRQEEQVGQAQEAIKRFKIACHDKEVQLKGTEQQISKHEKQMNEAGSKKEYDALRAEISAEKARGRAIEDEILDFMAKIEEETARIPEAEAAVKKAKEELAVHQRDAESRVVGIKQQLEGTLREIQSTEDTLPADIRPLYDRLISARGEDAMAAAEGRICRACYTEITAQNHNDLMLSQFVLCKSCGRVLYLPE
jgi:predicted  nucleic acid-binding Zn-ribbon protein